MSERQCKSSKSTMRFGRKFLIGGAVCGMLAMLQGCGDVKVTVPADKQLTLDAEKGLQVREMNGRTGKVVKDKKVAKKTDKEFQGQPAPEPKSQGALPSESDIYDAQMQVKKQLAMMQPVPVTVRTSSMPTCTACNKPTVMVAYDCYKPDCPAKNLCANCAEHKHCDHSWPWEIKVKNDQSDFVCDGRAPFGTKGPDGFSYWPTQEKDTVMCDICMQHMKTDILEWAWGKNADDLQKIGEFAMREHNAHADPSSLNAPAQKRSLRCYTPAPKDWNRFGHGCMNHDSENAMYLNEDRSVHVCKSCHGKITGPNAVSAESLFTSGWRRQDERAGKMVAKALSADEQAQREAKLLAELKAKVGKVKKWELMAFKPWSDDKNSA